MSARGRFDEEGHAYFVTFSCYRRRKILDAHLPRQIVISYLSAQLARQDGRCLGFVVMPDHVHSIVWFPQDNQLSLFIQQWKRLTSFELKRYLRTERNAYSLSFDMTDPIWQQKYYSFNIYSEEKLREKLAYMHGNPVKAGLVGDVHEWDHSSARWYRDGKSVGIKIGFV